MVNQHGIVSAIRSSECFKSEIAYLRRGEIAIRESPRLYKRLENDLIRAVFPSTIESIDEGTVVAVVTLYDVNAQKNIYAHTICAGPHVNTMLKTIYSPMAQAKPQPGIEGNKAISKFINWKEAAWVTFLNDELAQGTEAASRTWIENFWKALDRMFGGGVLQY